MWKRKAKKENKDRRLSIRDYTTDDPSLATYGTIGPTFRKACEQQTDIPDDENIYHEIDDVIRPTDTLSSRCSNTESNSSDVTNADSGIAEEDFVIPSIPQTRLTHDAVRKQLKKEKKKKGGMKPREKEKLARNRGMIVRTLDVALIMQDMRRAKVLDDKDEHYIMDDPRRRQRTARFLDVLEFKKTSAFEAFLDVIGDLYPQLYLQLVEWDGEDGDGFDLKQEDEWSRVRKLRSLLIEDLDCTEILPYLKEKQVLTSKEVTEIMKISSIKKRTEAFLDIVETKSVNAYEFFVESVSDPFPHLYLLLTEGGDDDDDLFDF